MLCYSNVEWIGLIFIYLFNEREKTHIKWHFTELNAIRKRERILIYIILIFMWKKMYCFKSKFSADNQIKHSLGYKWQHRYRCRYGCTHANDIDNVLWCKKNHLERKTKTSTWKRVQSFSQTGVTEAKLLFKRKLVFFCIWHASETRLNAPSVSWLRRSFGTSNVFGRWFDLLLPHALESIEMRMNLSKRW